MNKRHAEIFKVAGIKDVLTMPHFVKVCSSTGEVNMQFAFNCNGLSYSLDVCYGYEGSFSGSVSTVKTRNAGESVSLADFVSDDSGYWEFQSVNWASYQAKKGAIYTLFQEMNLNHVQGMSLNASGDPDLIAEIAIRIGMLNAQQF